MAFSEEVWTYATVFTFLRVVQRRCVWAVGGGVHCLPGLRRGGGGRQAGATVFSCLVWLCDLSLPDSPTSAFCVGVRPAVALPRPTHSDTDRDRTHLSGGRADSIIYTATPDTTKQSCLCRVWRGSVN